MEIIKDCKLNNTDHKMITNFLNLYKNTLYFIYSLIIKN